MTKAIFFLLLWAIRLVILITPLACFYFSFATPTSDGIDSATLVVTIFLGVFFWGYVLSFISHPNKFA